MPRFTVEVTFRTTNVYEVECATEQEASQEFYSRGTCVGVYDGETEHIEITEIGEGER